MPFESERQRRYMHANHPEIAQRWEDEMKRDGYDRNARNFEGDTYTFYDEPSEIPFVSPNVAAQDPRWTSGSPDYDMAWTASDFVIRGDSAYTRHVSPSTGEAGEDFTPTTATP